MPFFFARQCVVRRLKPPLLPDRFSRGCEISEEAEGRAVEGGIFGAQVGVAQAAVVVVESSQLADDVRARPAAPLAQALGFETSRLEGIVIGAKMPHRRGVSAGVLALQGTAVERLFVGKSLLQLGDDGVAVPLAIAADLIGIEAGRVQGAVPASKQPGLKRGEGGPAQVVAAAADGRPVQIILLALGGFDQLDDQRLGPAGAAGDLRVVDASALHGFSVGAKVIARGRDQRLHFFGEAIVGKVLAFAVKVAESLENSFLIPNASHEAPTTFKGVRELYRSRWSASALKRQKPAN